MFDNVPSRFLPSGEARPRLLFDHPALTDCCDRRQLNAAVELLDRSVDRFGREHIAYVCVSADSVQEISYGQLSSDVAQIANGLAARGVGVGDRVLTRFSEVPQAVAVQLAIWKLGAIAVPTAPVESARELAYFLNDAEVAAVITESPVSKEIADSLADASSLRLRVGWPDRIGRDSISFEDLMAGQPDTFEAFPTNALDASAIYYTGGTTGRPKGCLHTHAGEVAVADLGYKARGTTAKAVFLTHAPIGHAFGNWERISLPLRAGARAVLATRPSPREMWKLIAEHQVDTLAGAATMYRMMLAEVPHPRKEYPEIALTNAMSAGEVLDSVTARRWCDELGFPLRNVVGMAPLRAAFTESMSDGRKVAPGLSVGRPLPGYEVRIIDESGKNIDEPGRVGRLAVRGPTGITYWINKNEALEARAQSDVVDGWSILDDAYTQDENGYLWFRGRLDDMIVTGGRQVAPVEVEAVLARHDAVAEVAVFAADDGIRGQVVAAAVRPADGHQPSDYLAQELQTWVKQQLAGYKYPRRIVFVDQIPKDGVGKVQRRLLREKMAIVRSV